MAKLSPDKQWEWFNEDIQKYIKENNLNSLECTYYEMAEFLRKEGKENIYLRNLGYKTKLKLQTESLNEYKNSGNITGVEIIACTNTSNNNACEVCRKLNGKISPINEALLSNPLPVRDCLHLDGCRCVYGPVV